MKTISTFLNIINKCSALGVSHQKQILVYDQENNLGVDVFLNTSSDAKNVCVLFFYGGRWTTGQKKDFHFVAHRLIKLGYHAAIADYRKYPQVRFPSFIDDSAAAYVKVQAFFEPSTDIVVMGHSSGAQMGSLLCLNPDYIDRAGGDATTIKKFIGISGPYKFMDYIDQYDDLPDMFGPKEIYPESQSYHLSEKKLMKPPPMLLIHGKKDADVGVFNTEELARSISYNKGCVETLILPRVKHLGTISAFMPFNVRASSRIIIKTIDRFLQSSH